MELGKSKEDYLKAIYILQLKSRNVHSANIAEYMGVPIEIAKKDACSIEHVISTESYEKLKCVFP